MYLVYVCTHMNISFVASFFYQVEMKNILNFERFSFQKGRNQFTSHKHGTENNRSDKIIKTFLHLTLRASVVRLAGPCDLNSLDQRRSFGDIRGSVLCRWMWFCWLHLFTSRSEALDLLLEYDVVQIVKIDFVSLWVADQLKEFKYVVLFSWV